MAALFTDPGAFRSEFTLQGVTTEPDGLGGFNESWSDVATLFAKIEPVSAESIFGAGRALETVTHRITLRHRAGIASGMRLALGGRTFEIVTVHDPDETGRYLVCRTREEGA